MPEQAGFQFAFMEGSFEGEEIEKVGILEQLRGEIGLRRREGLAEVGDGLALTLVGLALDLEGEDVAAPAMRESLPGIPEARGQVFDLLDEDDVVRHGNLATACCQIWVASDSAGNCTTAGGTF